MVREKAPRTSREADSTRTPWVHTLDAQLSAHHGTAEQHLVTLSINALFENVGTFVAQNPRHFRTARSEAPSRGGLTGVPG